MKQNAPPREKGYGNNAELIAGGSRIDGSPALSKLRLEGYFCACTSSTCKVAFLLRERSSSDDNKDISTISKSTAVFCTGIHEATLLKACPNRWRTRHQLRRPTHQVFRAFDATHRRRHQTAPGISNTPMASSGSVNALTHPSPVMSTLRLRSICFLSLRLIHSQPSRPCLSLSV